MFRIIKYRFYLIAIKYIEDLLRFYIYIKHFLFWYVHSFGTFFYDGFNMQQCIQSNSL